MPEMTQFKLFNVVYYVYFKQRGEQLTTLELADGLHW